MLDKNYYTISQYVESGCDLRAKIANIDALIDAMELKLLDVVGTSDLEEYQMDDGQMRVRTRYRNTADVMNGIKSLEQLKQRYVNRLNGRSVVLRSGNIYYR